MVVKVQLARSSPVSAGRAKLWQPPRWLAGPHSPSERREGNTAQSSTPPTLKLCLEKLSRSSFKITEIQSEEMPAKENVLLLSESANQTILIRKDVDNLVQNIKENLKLTQYESSVQCPGLGGPPFVSSPLPDFSDYPTPVSDSSQIFKARSFAASRSSRASPYGLAGKAKCEQCLEGPGLKRASWAARKRYPSMSASKPGKPVELEDPLEMLHELIR
jgi:hypothetical protein